MHKDKNSVQLTNKNHSDDNKTLSSISFTDNTSKILNKNYTFEKFIVDQSNELAYFSAQRVGKEFNIDYKLFYLWKWVLGKLIF